MICLRCLVSGRVQGVWYRASTREQAYKNGISGYAKNLADGRVEVLACGEPEAVASLCDWLWLGPSAANVDAVECNETKESPIEGFSIA
ncbi:MAG: acylphosphatase [Pseudomonadota bacterium]